MTTHGQTINDIQPGRSVVLARVEYGGSLEARRLPSGKVAFYWRHSQAGTTARMPIGTYDSGAAPKSLKPTPRGYSVAAALEAARALAKRNAETPGGLRAERERNAAEAAAAKRALDARARYTLGALCDTYCDWLKQQGKDSHREARTIFTNHLKVAFPEVFAASAAEVDKRQVVGVIRKLTEAKKQATARKLRSYLRAAYACAVKADSDPGLPAAFIAFNVLTNPVESTAAVKARTDKNPLSMEDLRRYWQELRREPGLAGAALRLHVVTGAQRIAQLARLHERDVGPDWIRLWDRKGKRVEARSHLLPITSEIRTELDQLSSKGFALSTDAGHTPMHPTTLSAWAAKIGKRAGLSDFQLKRVRSGVETVLASGGVALHVRGQLQSHGTGGVQERHYDAHHYLPEKRRALGQLYDVLAGDGPTSARKKASRTRQMKKPIAAAELRGVTNQRRSSTT